jgi:ribosome-associated protein
MSISLEDESQRERRHAEAKSKSQLKRELLALRDLGKQLVDLPQSRLQGMQLSPPLLAAVVDAKRFKRGALKRQLQHIAGLLRSQDSAAVREALDDIHRPQQREVEHLHEVEGWRDALLAGDTQLLDELAARYRHADRQQLRQLVRNADRERQHNQPPKSARALFRTLMALRQEEQA